MKARWITAACAALVLVVGSVALAQDKKPMQPGKPGQGRMVKSTKMVYTCAACKMYYTPTQAKQMRYKDAMGHKLTRKMKAPAGFKMGSHGKMHGEDKSQGKEKEKTADQQASTMKCPVCKTMDMTSTQTANNTQEVKIKGKTWYCCSGCDMSTVADKP